MAIRETDDTETFEQAIAELNAVACDAFNRGDAKACAALYTRDAVVFLPGRGPVEGRESIEAFLGEYIAAGARLTSVNPIKLGASGDVGYCAGTCRFDTPAGDGSTVSEIGKFVTVFQRQPDGSWQAVVDSLIRDPGS